MLSYFFPGTAKLNKCPKLFFPNTVISKFPVNHPSKLNYPHPQICVRLDKFLKERIPVTISIGQITNTSFYAVKTRSVEKLIWGLGGITDGDFCQPDKWTKPEGPEGNPIDEISS